jgi:CheY-like chemotaxis protein
MPKTKRPRVLLVDEDGLPTEFYHALLTEHHFDVTWTDTTDKAMEKVRNEEAFDLVVLDCMMPTGNVLKNTNTQDGMRTGIELCDLIKKTVSNIYVIFLTNVRNYDLLEEMWQRTSRNLVRQKASTPPSVLLKEIQTLLA